jgi:hypothetical protein
VLDCGSQELRGGEDFKIPFCPPAAAGAVDDPAGLFDPGDLFQRERSAEQILRELLTTCGAMDGAIAGIDAEATVFPVQKLAGLSFADDLLVEEVRNEAVAEEPTASVSTNTLRPFVKSNCSSIAIRNGWTTRSPRSIPPTYSLPLRRAASF